MTTDEIKMVENLSETIARLTRMLEHYAAPQVMVLEDPGVKFVR